MSAGYVLFLLTALVATGIILVYYSGLQSDITNSEKHISVLERQLNELKVANEEDYKQCRSGGNQKDCDSGTGHAVCAGRADHIFCQ